MQTPKLGGGVGGNPCGESMHGIWKSDVREVSGGEEFSQNADTTLEWNIKCSNLFQGFWSVTKKKGSSSLSNGSKLTITHYTFFKKGFCQAYAPLRKKSLSIYACKWSEWWTDVQHTCDETTTIVILFHSLIGDSTGNRRILYSRTNMPTVSQHSNYIAHLVQEI